MRTATDVRAWTEALFGAIDAKDTEAFVGFLADDGRFCYGNFPPAIGRDAIRTAVAGFFGSIASLSHRIDDVWSVPGHVICRGTATYTRHDARVVPIAFCNVLALAGERVTDYRIYIDPSPLAAP